MIGKRRLRSTKIISGYVAIRPAAQQVCGQLLSSLSKTRLVLTERERERERGRER